MTAHAHHRPLPALAALLLLLAVVPACRTAAPGGGPAPGGAGPPVLDFLGVATLPAAGEYEGTRVGGLSALAWDAADGSWLALSDDRSHHAPARFYRLTIDLGADGRLDDGDVEVAGVTVLRDLDGGPFAEGSVDPEGLAVTAGGTLLVSSEGDAADGIPPFVREVDRDGAFRRAFEVPSRFAPGTGRGVRDNRGFEALALTPDGGTLFVAAEGPLSQDEPPPALGRGARARVLRVDPVSGRPLGEVLYPLDPVPAPAVPPDGFAANGLVELLALGDDRLLALERSFVAGHGFFLRLYRVELSGATDVASLAALPAPDAAGAPALAGKSLLLDLANLGVPLYNTEGMALGPALQDGRRLLLLISDDNFAADQRSQLLAFAVDPRRLATAPPPAPRESTIAAVQGGGHVSPLVGRDVTVEGVVTAVGEEGFHLQDPAGDGDPATSEGLAVRTGGLLAAAPPPAVAVGERVRVSGRVLEVGRGPEDLTVTTVAAAPELGPPAGRLGRHGRAEPPAPLPVGGGAPCPPGRDFVAGLAFWESLEGMRLALAAPTVVGPTSRYGDLAVVPEGCAEGPRTVHGGLLLRRGDGNPERLLLAPRPGERTPPLAVGLRFAAPVTGVLAYDYGTFRLLPEAWPALAGTPPARQRSRLPDGDGLLSVATLNAENLSARSPDAELAALAATVVEALGAPALLALQEVQDDSGAADDGTVSAAATLDRLTDAVVAAGGPRYAWRQVDPRDGADGGRPGGNIRNAVLADPARLTFVDRPAAVAAGAGEPGAVVLRGPDGPELHPSPGRLAPDHPAFRHSRKPLVVELRPGPLFVVANHFRSKGGDDSLFGAVQPPRRPSDGQRAEQARLVADLAAGILAADPEARVLVLGDLNDFPFRPTLSPLTDAGLGNLVPRLAQAERYTFVYRGNSQVLDHVLASPALERRLVGIDAVHRHADFPAADRPSDHDPLVAVFRWP